MEARRQRKLHHNRETGDSIAYSESERIFVFKDKIMISYKYEMNTCQRFYVPY